MRFRLGASPARLSGVSDFAPVEEVKPRLRGVLHEWAFYLAIPLGVAVGMLADTALAKVAAAVYAGGVVCMFGASALYHRVTWSPPWRRWLRRVDHAGIYAMIAASYKLSPETSTLWQTPDGPVQLTVHAFSAISESVADSPSFRL